MNNLELMKPNGGELQRSEAELPAHSDDPMMLLTMAVQKGADVGTLERLSVLRDKFLAEKARKAYFAALAVFQKECPVIVKTSRVMVDGAERYRFAPIDKIIKIVGPLLEKHGFAFQRDSKADNGWIEAIVTITHREGHSETKSFRVPTETNAKMSPAQKFGAALTFADRYAFCGALGIKTGDEDTDGPQTGQDGPEVKAGLKAMLWKLLKKFQPDNTTWDQMQQFCIDEALIEQDQQIREILQDTAAMRKTIKNLESR